MKNIFLQSNLSIKFLARDTAFYGIMTGLTRLSAFILVPLLTRSLSKGEFAVVDTLLMLSTMGLVLGNAGMDSALMFHYYHVPQSERSCYVATGLWIRFTFGLLVALLGILFAPAISSGVFGNEEFTLWTILAVASVPFALVVSYALDVLRIERARWWFMSLSLLRVVLLISGSWVILESVHSDRVESFLIFRTIPEFIVALCLVGLMARKHRLFRVGKKAAWDLLRYGMPLVPAAFMLWALTFIDRWYLFQSIELSQVGVYALAVKVGMVLTLFTSAIQMAFNPFSMAVKEDERSGVFYARAFSLTMCAAVASVVLICANLSWIVGVIGGATGYADASLPAAILLIGNLFHTAFVFVSTGANIKRKTMFHVYAFLVALLVDILLLIVLVPAWGIVGAAVAVCCGHVVLAATTLALSHRVHPIQFNILPVGAGIMAGAAVSLIIATQFSGGGVTSILLQNLVILLFIPILFRIMLGKNEGGKLFQLFRPTVVK
ncbi:MAG: lipopolysaccharide biosynthesis protein [Bacteroidota bacterium]